MRFSLVKNIIKVLKEEQNCGKIGKRKGKKGNKRLNFPTRQ